MEQALTDYGLSEKEAAVYVVCLKTGMATANMISELSLIPRSTVYDILDKLQASGLVSTTIVGGKTHFSASDPGVLLTNLEEKKRSILSILPRLREIQNKISEKPISEVYQGKTAIIKLLDEILDRGETMSIIGSQGNALDKIGYHPDKFRKKRLEKKIRCRQILELSDEAESVKDDRYTRVKYIPDLASAKEAIFILKEHVYHIIFQHEISAIKVKSKDHGKTMQILFNLMWNSSSEKMSKKPDKQGYSIRL